MIKILITSGGTKEKIDQVRILTNISSGKLGAKIAEAFCDANYFKAKFVTQDIKVSYLHSKGAVMPKGKPLEWNVDYQVPTVFTTNNHSLENVEVNSVQELYDKMEELIPQMNIVIHCMAVSDFTFKQNNVKLKSNDADGFIDYMRANIVKTPKIISKIKEWNKNVFLVGFKFEVGLTEEELVSVACDALSAYSGDIVVANDKEQMTQAQDHVAFICKNKKDYYKVVGKEMIADALLKETVLKRNL
jgi:phosphopantothenate-cysteine ligase